MSRPIIVYAGQGLSLADDFNLTQELRWLKGHCFAEAEHPSNLDEVLLLLRERMTPQHYATNTGYLYEVLRTLDLLCSQDAYTLRRPTLDTTIALCKRLAAIADHRLVVLFTSNLDCVARYEAVANGAAWLLGKTPSGLQCWHAIEKWFTEVAQRSSGFHYMPLHGEAGLFSSGDGGSTALATKDALLSSLEPWGYTTGEGLGRNVTMIEQRMHLSQAGYRLFRALLGGTDFDAGLHNRVAEDDTVPPSRRSALVSADAARAAHLLVVGYGAPHLLGGRPYPFETSIDLAYRSLRRLACTAGWKAILGPDRYGVDWFAEHGFSIASVESGTPNTCLALITKALDELDRAP